ncbi:MAG: hypothetical protein IJD38_07965 [Clostridia bacterium]|nr:hypothetical protein [Clostridia bacterium]
MNPLFGMMQDEPVYFAVNGHRYVIEAFFEDEFGRGPDELAQPNAFFLKDVETGSVTVFSGRNAVKQAIQYPLAGGATIKSHMKTFDYWVSEGFLQNQVTLLVYVSTRFAEDFMTRLHGVTDRLGMRLLSDECHAYWKIDGMSSISVIADRAPTQDVDAWKAIFEELFRHMDYCVKTDTDAHGPVTVISRYTTPEETDNPDTEAYFAVMRISAPNES